MQTKQTTKSHHFFREFSGEINNNLIYFFVVKNGGQFETCRMCYAKRVRCIICIISIGFDNTRTYTIHHAHLCSHART